MIDLHVHSTFSDGSLTPRQLVQEARRIGLKAMALTDHDTMDGVTPFLDACREEGNGLEAVPGVEISADSPHGPVHILGYFVDATVPALAGALAEIRGGRDARNHRIIEKLNAQGCRLTLEQVSAYAGEDVVGRPHFAMALQAAGYVTSKAEAFDRYLGRGAAAYVDRYRLEIEESIEIIRQAGGVPVLAHPVTLGLGRASLRDFVRSLRDCGLEGLEAYYPEHAPEQEGQYLSLAANLGLVPTGGSDFHGETNPAVRLGFGFGPLHVPDEVVEELKARRPGA